MRPCKGAKEVFDKYFGFLQKLWNTHTTFHKTTVNGMHHNEQKGVQGWDAFCLFTF